MTLHMDHITGLIYATRRIIRLGRTFAKHCSLIIRLFISKVKQMDPPSRRTILGSSSAEKALMKHGYRNTAIINIAEYLLIIIPCEK